MPHDIESRVRLISEVGVEVTTREDLQAALERKPWTVAYDGFEPSGRMHIAQGLLRARNIQRLREAGVSFKMLVADWHAQANNKMGGDLDKIQTVGRYFIEIWRSLGLVEDDYLSFVWASDLVEESGYWDTVFQVARHASLERILRTTQIMGRSESDKLSGAQIFYPCMQVADIFHLDVDIAQLGMDQRKVNMLAREVAPKLGREKPVALHHEMLMGLKHVPVAENTSPEVRATALKMSKSDPTSAVFMTDTREEVDRKLQKAWCPPGEVADNPVLQWARLFAFEGRTEPIEFKSTHTGYNLVTIGSYTEMERLFVKGDLHPADLKALVASAINAQLEPVRGHFERNAGARRLKEQVEEMKVTR